MSKVVKRATISFDPDLHRALRIRAAETDRSISNLVNAAVSHSLAEDGVDLAAFQDRVHEPTVVFEDVLRGPRA
jgi:plasmid stability protein